MKFDNFELNDIAQALCAKVDALATHLETLDEMAKLADAGEPVPMLNRGAVREISKDIRLRRDRLQSLLDRISDEMYPTVGLCAKCGAPVEESGHCYDCDGMT